MRKSGNNTTGATKLNTLMHHTLSLLSLCAFLVLFLFPFSWHTPKQNSKNKTPKRKMHILSSHDTETKNGIITPRPKTRGAHQEKKTSTTNDKQTSKSMTTKWVFLSFFFFSWFFLRSALSVSSAHAHAFPFLPHKQGERLHAGFHQGVPNFAHSLVKSIWRWLESAFWFAVIVVTFFHLTACHFTGHDEPNGLELVT